MKSYYMNTLLFAVAALAILFFAGRYINAGQSLSMPEFIAASDDSPESTVPQVSPLRGHRTFAATMRFGQLTFHGAAFTFEDKEATDGFTPYNFAFRTDQFTQTPRMGDTLISAFYRRHNASFSDNSGVLTNTCVNPREGTNTSADGIALTAPILCMITSDVSGRQLGMIGLVQPTDNAVGLASGDATCRGEIAHWRTLPNFSNIKIILCAVVDRPYNPDARRADSWMDVIYYQQISDTQLVNLQATDRNSRPLEGS